MIEHANRLHVLKRSSIEIVVQSVVIPGMLHMGEYEFNLSSERFSTRSDGSQEVLTVILTGSTVLIPLTTWSCNVELDTAADVD